MAPVPVVWFVRKFKIIKMETDIPVVSPNLYSLILSADWFFANTFVTSLLVKLVSVVVDFGFYFRFLESFQVI